MKRIFNYLDHEKIIYRTDYLKSMAFIGEYPKDIRISKTDKDYTKEGYPNTNKYYYRISWIIWNKTNMKIKEAYTINEAKKIIQTAMEELDLFNFGEQLKLF